MQQGGGISRMVGEIRMRAAGRRDEYNADRADRLRFFVPIGLYLTFVGWIAKPPAAS